jgi:alkylation response protein AidB-like acyl-CoA dehydrogenase
VRELLARLDELAPLFRASASEADRLARLPRPVVAALIQHGLFRLWVPKRTAGFELDLPDALQIYEAAARIDGSVGWAVMIGSGGGLFAAYLDPGTAHAIYGRPDAVIAGSGAPDGRAERVADGYRATGCWRYASGAHYATTFTANCLILERGTIVVGTDGRPLIRAMAFDVPQVTVLPAWDPSGMRGTGSDDFEVRDAFVPEARTFSVFTDTPRETGPVYRLPFGVLTELPVAFVTLGIARHALEAFDALARRKKSAGSSIPLAGDPLVQGRYAEALSMWRLAKAGLTTLAHEAWQAALAESALSPRELAEITAGCAFAVSRLRAAVGELVALSGMTGIQSDDELARAWRDLQAVAAHISVSPRHLPTSGAVLLSGQYPANGAEP